MSETAAAPPPHASTWRPLAVSTAMLAIAIVYLRWQGRVWWCACGHWWPVILNVNSEHNSQHVFDPYAFSHLLHGVLFFGLLWLVAGRLGVGWRLLVALAIELIWEMAENSPFVIDRYRAGTVSLGYTGDSIANSLGDIASCVAGFYLARRIGLWGSVALIVAVEVGMLFWLRDNLTLNVLMLVHPVDAVRRWQSGG